MMPDALNRLAMIVGYLCLICAVVWALTCMATTLIDRYRGLTVKLVNPWKRDTWNPASTTHESTRTSW